MKKYLCIIIAAMLLAMVPTTVEAQTKQKSKTRVERKTTKKQSRKKAKKSTSKNNDNKQQLDYKWETDDDVKVKREVDARHDYDVVRTIKEEIVMEQPAQNSDWNNEEKIYTSVEQMPQYPGGNVAMMKYIQSHIKYPPMAKENNIQGNVVVQFVVLKDGSIGEVKIARSVDKDLDKEAVRVVKSFPKFTPGRKNGQPVAVWYTLPVSFKL